MKTSPYTVEGYPSQSVDRCEAPGSDLNAIQVASAHADAAMTADYIKSRDVLVSTVKVGVADGIKLEDFQLGSKNC